MNNLHVLFITYVHYKANKYFPDYSHFYIVHYVFYTRNCLDSDQYSCLRSQNRMFRHHTLQEKQSKMT